MSRCSSVSPNSIARPFVLRIAYCAHQAWVEEPTTLAPLRNTQYAILSVLVKPFPTFPPKPPGLYHLDQQWAGAVLGVFEAVVEHVEDVQAYVETDEVGERQRPHGVIHAQFHDGVDVFPGGYALKQGEYRLVDHRHQHRVGDETGVIAHLYRGLAQLLGRGADGSVGLIAGGQPPDDLHQGHQGHRVEEV